MKELVMLKRFKFGHDILVRDKRPEIMENNGLKVRKKTLSNEEFQSEILRKLIE
jgi:predicted house-cleaning noncanonical NTP pyrophosphatase (MazG superfamily)